MMLWGVILSIVIAVAASYTALDLAGRVAARKGWTFATWLTGCSLTMGVRLPGTSGLNLQQRLSQSGVRMPIIFITGHGDIPMSEGGRYRIPHKAIPRPGLA